MRGIQVRMQRHSQSLPRSATLHAPAAPSESLTRGTFSCNQLSTFVGGHASVAVEFA